ncbi:hypothetical protein P879_09100, partial [Paragonimus westermani]
SLRDWVRKYVRGLANSTAGGPSAQQSKAGNHKLNQPPPSEASKSMTSIMSSRWPRPSRLYQTRLSAPGSTNVTPENNTVGSSMSASDFSGVCKPRTTSLPGKPCLSPLRSGRIHRIQNIHVIQRTSSIRALETIEHWGLPSGKLECALTSVVSSEAQVETGKLNQKSTDNSFTPSVSTEDLFRSQNGQPNTAGIQPVRLSKDGETIIHPKQIINENEGMVTTLPDRKDSHRMLKNGSSMVIHTTNTGKTPREHTRNIREVYNKKDVSQSSKIGISLSKPVVGFHVDVTRCFGDQLLSVRKKTDRKFHVTSRQTDNELQNFDVFRKSVTSLKTENRIAGPPPSCDMRASEASCVEVMTFRSMATTIYDRKQRPLHKTHRTKSQAFEPDTHKLNSTGRKTQPCGRTYLHTNFSTTSSPESLADHPTDLMAEKVSFGLPGFSNSESTLHLKGMNHNLRSSGLNVSTTEKLTVKPKSHISSSTKKSSFRKWPFAHKHTNNNNTAPKIAMDELTPPDIIRMPTLMTCMPPYSDRCSFAANITVGPQNDEYMVGCTEDQSHSLLDSYSVEPVQSCCTQSTLFNHSCNTKENSMKLLAEPPDIYSNNQKHFTKPPICSSSLSAVTRCESR